MATSYPVLPSLLISFRHFFVDTIGVEDPSMPVIVWPIRDAGARRVISFESARELEVCRISIGGRANEQMVQEKFGCRLGSLYQAASIHDGEGKHISFFISSSIRAMFPWGGRLGLCLYWNHGSPNSLMR